MKFLKLKVHFPIVLKLVFLTSFLIVSVALIIAWENSKLFEQISTDREESSAEMLISSKAMEMEAIFESYTDKLSSLAQNVNQKKTLSGDLVYFKLESLEQNGFELSNENLTKISPETFQVFLDSHKAALSSIQSGKVYISNTAHSFKEPMLLMGAPVAKENGQVSHWAWGLFRLNRLQASFEKAQSLSVYLVDSTGKVIVHPDEKNTINGTDLSSNNAVKQLLGSDLSQRQQYIDDKFYSVSRTLFGPIVVGEISQKTILRPAVLAKESSFFILGIILSISFFLSVLFCHSISRNIENLTELVYRIADGDFDVNAGKQIKTKDEIGLLANAFDDMTEGLKERDKIKNIFTKFHGTAVTDELLNKEDMRKGNKCEAVVFFSDIRGFTDFSNHKTPEEVVKMLNEYFEVMVTIINKHGGIVDKFVGDAIMAVWGAPQGTEHDARNAVLACLEMRQALAELNQTRLENGHTPIMMGMGLHAGPVVAGTVGSNDRLEYTVIGDTVNTASRIESATKSFGTDLLISEEVAHRIGEDFIITLAGSTKVKGKNSVLKLAKVSGYYDENFNPCLISTPYSSYEAEESEKVKVVA